VTGHTVDLSTPVTWGYDVGANVVGETYNVIRNLLWAIPEVLGVLHYSDSFTFSASRCPREH
jgi:hypothetical protein